MNPIKTRRFRRARIETLMAGIPVPKERAPRTRPGRQASPGRQARPGASASTALPPYGLRRPPTPPRRTRARCPVERPLRRAPSPGLPPTGAPPRRFPPPTAASRTAPAMNSAVSSVSRTLPILGPASGAHRTIAAATTADTPAASNTADPIVRPAFTAGIPWPATALTGSCAPTSTAQSCFSHRSQCTTNNTTAAATASWYTMIVTSPAANTRKFIVPCLPALACSIHRTARTRASRPGRAATAGSGP